MINLGRQHENKTRVQLDLRPKELERMNTIMYLADIETRKDLFNHALSLFEWAVGEVRTGKQVGSVDKSNREFTILSMPSLASAAVKDQVYQAAVPTGTYGTGDASVGNPSALCQAVGGVGPGTGDASVGNPSAPMKAIS